MLRVAALKGGYELMAGKIDVDTNTKYVAEGHLFRAEASKKLSHDERLHIQQINRALPSKLKI